MPKIFDTQTIIIQTGGGGTPIPGNLRWGPNFGNNEQRTFGAAGALSLVEFRAKVQHDLFCVGELILKSDITALLPMFVQGMLDIFFTLVFLYFLVVAERITMPALQLHGGLQVAEAVILKTDIAALFSTFVQGLIDISALTEVGLTRVAGALTGAYQIDSLDLAVAGSIKGLLSPAFGMFVANKITMPALTEVGLTRVAGALVGAYQIDSLDLAVAGSISAFKGDINALFPTFVQGELDIFFTLVFLYFLNVAGALNLSALQLQGLLQAAVAITGALGPQYGTIVAGRIIMSALAEVGETKVAGAMALAQSQIGGLQTNVAGAITMPALAEADFTKVACAITSPTLGLVGLTQVNATTKMTSMQIGGLMLAAQGSLSGKLSLDIENLIARGAITQSGLSLVGSTSVNSLPKITALNLGDATGTTGLGLECRTAALGLTYQLDFTDVTVNTDRNFTVPAGVTSLMAEVWGGGGGGGTSSVNGGGGGGGGGFARETARPVAAGDNIIVRSGSGGVVAAVGQQSRVTHIATVIAAANGGTQGANGAVGGHGAGGAGGAGVTGDVGNLFTGGAGGGPTGVNIDGGGGGGGAGTIEVGGVGGAAVGSGGPAGLGGDVHPYLGRAIDPPLEETGNGGKGAGGTTAATVPPRRGGGGGGASTAAAASAGSRGGARLTFAA